MVSDKVDFLAGNCMGAMALVLVRLDHVASFIVQRESSQLSIRVVERNDALNIAR